MSRRVLFLFALVSLTSGSFPGCAFSGDQYLFGRSTELAVEAYRDNPWAIIYAPLLTPLALAADIVALPVALPWDLSVPAPRECTSSAEECAPEVHESGPKTNEPTPEADESTPEADEPTPEADEPAPTPDESAPTPDESAPEADEPAPTPNEPAPGAKETTPELEESASKAGS